MGSATIFESLVAAAKHHLDDVSRAAHRSQVSHPRRQREVARRLGSRLLPHAQCPVCADEQRAGAWHLDMFVEALFDAGLGSELQTLHQDSEGLCYLHLIGCIQRCAGPEQVTHLLALERPKWEELEAELEEYLRKHEAVHREEPLGEALDAWARAARKLAGAQVPGLALERLVEVAKKREKR